MEIRITKKLKNPTIIVGFPGFGLVGTIATEFLIDHLKTELIGDIWLPELPAIAAVHKQELVQPLGIHYNKQYNIVILHGVTSITGIEWDLTEVVHKLEKDFNAKEVICLEGIGSNALSEQEESFFLTSDEKRKRVLSKYSKILDEGIIMGVTGALLIKKTKAPITAIFAETRSNLPDSKAAAKIIEVLDKYLGLKVDYKPLLKQAEKFEQKLKTLMVQSKDASVEKEKKQLSYVG